LSSLCIIAELCRRVKSSVIIAFFAAKFCFDFSKARSLLGNKRRSGALLQ